MNAVLLTFYSSKNPGGKSQNNEMKWNLKIKIKIKQNKIKLSSTTVSNIDKSDAEKSALPHHRIKLYFNVY